jgi:hypothetical protein
VWLVGLISLVNDSASDLIYPLLPLYLTSVLLAGPKALGLIEGIAEATGSLLKLVSGAFSDRSGRIRPWIVTGYGMAGLARPLIALAASWPVVLLLRFADRVGKGRRGSPQDALLAQAVAPRIFKVSQLISPSGMPMSIGTTSWSMHTPMGVMPTTAIGIESSTVMAEFQLRCAP